MTATAAPTISAAQQAANQDAAAQRAILSYGVRMRTPLPAISVTPANQPTVVFQVNNVGLTTGFLVKVQGTIHNGNGANALALTPFGPANVLTNITLTDYQNQQRIYTPGWHQYMVNAAKHPLVFGAAVTYNGFPIGFGNNWTVISAASAPAAGADSTIQMYYYVAAAYAKNDLRGAIYSSLTNATASLSVTINQFPIALAGADASLAVYSNGDTAQGWKANTTVTFTVWQDYINQLPRDNSGNPYLPGLALQTVYELKQTALTALVVGQEFPIQYASYRAFQSTTVVFDNGGTLNTGSDITYWAMRTANTTALFNVGPNEVALSARHTFGADPPKGVYYFDHRAAPINTLVFGNQALNLNASTVNAGASLLVGFESFANISQLQYGPSLPAS